MHFDALTLACMVSELAPALIPGRIQQVVQTGPHALGLEVYAQGQRRWLLLSAAPDDGRIHLASAKSRRGVEKETPLLLLLRKYVRDAILSDLRQPNPAERLLTLVFRHKQHGVTHLHMELLGRAANLVLTRESGAILDCLHRVPGDDGARRILLPGRAYAPPPLATRISPLLPADELTLALAPIIAAPGPLWKVLGARVAGMGPSQAREVERRTLLALGDETLRTDAGAQALADSIASLWAPVRSGLWEPGVWLEDEVVVGYSAWRPTPGADAPVFAPRASLSLAIAEALEPRATTPAATNQPALAHDAYAAQRASVAQSLRAARARLLRALDALAADEPAPGAADALRTQAEWLLALHTTLAPDATHLTLSPEQTGGPALHLALDPNHSPVQQAERMFLRAAKLDRAAAFIPTRRARLLNDLAYLSDLEADLAQAQNQPEIAATRSALALSGLAAWRPSAKGNPAGRATAVGQPRRFQTDDGFQILIGRNARQNDHLTFDLASASDLWLHVRGAPGAHVVILAHGRAPSAPTVEMAAQLAGYYSTLRGERAVDVVLAERRHVSRLQGGNPGQVTVRQERVLRVPADLPEGVTPDT